MKKNSLTTAILAGVAGVAGLAGVAHAVNLNPDGLGQVLIYPYYTVNGGNSTVVTVVNTTDAVKAVKVRFVEALNSAEVLDFNLYLSPYDVWAANVVAAGNGAALRVSDTSCTVPNIVDGQAFLTYEFTQNSPDALASLGVPRTRQGHLEIIEMGVVTDPYLAAAATHLAATGAPADCGELQAAWDGGQWAADRHDGVASPNGGLFGGATIISGQYGRTLSYNADAIDGFYRGASTLHFPPGDTAPALDQATGAVAGTVSARVFSNGSLYEIDYSNGIDAVSAAFQARYIYNEYNLNAGLDAASEWVITFPTKRSYVHAPAARLPFTTRFTAAGSCHSYAIKYWNREERTTTRGLTVSPQPQQPGFSLCWEANVLAFGQDLSAATTATRILGATSTYGGYGLSGFEYQEGWARIEFDNPTAANFQYWLPSDDGQALVGQPVTGFWASEVVNNNVEAGVRANYGVIHKHRVSRDCRTYTGTGATLAANAANCPAL